MRMQLLIYVPKRKLSIHNVRVKNEMRKFVNRSEKINIEN